MGLLTKNYEAKARRTQEREEQQKKAKAVPPPYSHTPTHALNDALLSVPHAYKSTDKHRLKEAHQQRLEKEASALAAGSDTNVTDIPAKYWQGQPLPSTFKAPTPAGLAKLASSRPSLKGKKTEMPAALKAQQDPKKPKEPKDEGYASGNGQDNTGKYHREPAISHRGSSGEPGVKRSKQHQAAEADREAEVEELRRRIKELEGKQKAQNDPNLKLVAGARPASVRRGNAGMRSPFDSKTSKTSKTSSSDALKWLSSGKSQEKSEPTPSTSLSVKNEGVQAGDGVNRYDWAFHWARLAARTDEERDKIPPAINPQERKVRKEKVKACYESLDEFSRRFDPAPEAQPSRSSRCGSIKTHERPGSASAASCATVAGSRPTRDTRNRVITPSHSDVSDFDFGFSPAATSSTTRHGDYSSRPGNHANKAKDSALSYCTNENLI